MIGRGEWKRGRSGRKKFTANQKTNYQQQKNQNPIFLHSTLLWFGLGLGYIYYYPVTIIYHKCALGIKAKIDKSRKFSHLVNNIDVKITNDNQNDKKSDWSSRFFVSVWF